MKIIKVVKSLFSSKKTEEKVLGDPVGVEVYLSMYRQDKSTPYMDESDPDSLDGLLLYY